MFIHRRIVRIEWGDCDAAGIVYYPRYFEMFDASTTHLFEAAGFPKKDAQARFGILGWPMLDTRANFKIPSSYGDDIVIESCVVRWGRSSFDIEHRVIKDETLAIEAWEKRVWAARDPEDLLKIRSVPIPVEIIARLSAS